MDNEFIQVKIYYKKIGHKYVAYTEQEFNKTIKEEEKKNYMSLMAKFFELSWGLYNELQESAIMENSNGERQFNYKIFKENRLRKLMKEWDAQKDGKPVPINEKSISMLSPVIAEALLRSYDDMVILGEEEEKK